MIFTLVTSLSMPIVQKYCFIPQKLLSTTFVDLAPLNSLGLKISILCLRVTVSISLPTIALHYTSSRLSLSISFFKDSIMSSSRALFIQVTISTVALRVPCISPLGSSFVESSSLMWLLTISRLFFISHADSSSLVILSSLNNRIFLELLAFLVLPSSVRHLDLLQKSLSQLSTLTESDSDTNCHEPGLQPSKP